MKTTAITLIIAPLALIGLAVAQPANAAGCLRGAAVGGAAGHLAGHHGLIGAGVGCLIGRHEANRRFRDQGYDGRY
jgi:hypothetical protein